MNKNSIIAVLQIDFGEFGVGGLQSFDSLHFRMQLFSWHPKITKKPHDWCWGLKTTKLN